MALLFCCPVCGSNLRVTRSAGVSVVACPGCSEPIRVPQKPHPAESAFDTPAVRATDANRARAGLARLSLSLGLFGLCALISLMIFSLRASVGKIPEDQVPEWVPFAITALTSIWLSLGLLGCWFRLRGYLQCRRAGSAVGVELWVRLAAAGSVFTAIGELASMPWFLGRSLKSLPPELAAVVTIGLLCGVIGIVMEFAFLSAIHRLLWETAGWQAANKTGSYAIAFIFSMVAAMATVSAGGMIVVLAAGGKPGQIAPPEPVMNPLPLEIRVVTILVLSMLSGITALVCWRYARLLRLTRRSLTTPQPYSSPVVSEQK